MKPRHFNLDLADELAEPPSAGDMLFSTIAAYVILEVRPVESRVWPFRWALTVRRVARDHQPAEGARAWHTQPYRKGERPEDVFGPAPVAA